MKLICKICGKEIENIHGDPYTIRDFLSHLMNSHQINKEDYLVKYELNGVHPLCACGCGNPVKPDKGWNVWRKYYKDHKNTVKASPDVVEKQKQIMIDRYKDPKYDVMSMEDIKSSLEEFRRGVSLRKLVDHYGHDKRTIKNLWMKYNLIDEVEYTKLAEINQKNAAFLAKSTRIRESISYYESIHKFILDNKYKYNISEVNSIFGNKTTNTTLMKNLLKLYKDGFDKFLLFGVKSKEEVQYIDILRYFFGAANVRYGFRLEEKLFDALLFNKILLEYDGSYYHSSKKSKLNDEEKDKIAKRNGYLLIRVNENTSKDINILKKIKDYVKGKIQTKKNRKNRKKNKRR